MYIIAHNQNSKQVTCTVAMLRCPQNNMPKFLNKLHHPNVCYTMYAHVHYNFLYHSVTNPERPTPYCPSFSDSATMQEQSSASSSSLLPPISTASPYPLTPEPQGGNINVTPSPTLSDTQEQSSASSSSLLPPISTASPYPLAPEPQGGNINVTPSPTLSDTQEQSSASSSSLLPISMASPYPLAPEPQEGNINVTPSPTLSNTQEQSQHPPHHCFLQSTQRHPILLLPNHKKETLTSHRCQHFRHARTIISMRMLMIVLVCRKMLATV